MKTKVTCITVMSTARPNLSSKPFVSVFFGRGEQSNHSHYDPTPSSMLRVMRWQAATLIASRNSEATK